MSDSSNFDVIEQDTNGEPVRCSSCTRGVPRVVVLSLTQMHDPDEDLVSVDGDALWVGLCAYCVLAMAKALAQNVNEVTP